MNRIGVILVLSVWLWGFACSGDEHSDAVASRRKFEDAIGQAVASAEFKDKLKEGESLVAAAGVLIQAVLDAHVEGIDAEDPSSLTPQQLEQIQHYLEERSIGNFSKLAGSLKPSESNALRQLKQVEAVGGSVGGGDFHPGGLPGGSVVVPTPDEILQGKLLPMRGSGSGQTAWQKYQNEKRFWDA